jgi:hypothetical protein
MPATPPNRLVLGLFPYCSIRNPLRRTSATVAMMFPSFVLKMRQALTFLATIGNEFGTMKTLGIISILALLTITGAVYTDQVLVSAQQLAQGLN